MRFSGLPLLISSGVCKNHLHFSTKDELIKDEVGLLKVENNVELTNRSKVFVEHFHIPYKMSQILFQIQSSI